MERFFEMVGWGGQLGGIQNHSGGFDEKRLVTLMLLDHTKNPLKVRINFFFVKSTIFI